MPDRRYTYTVEIDAAQARQAATQLRAMFERELAQIMTPASAGRSTPDQTMQRTQQTAEATKRTFEQISKIDLTANTEKLFAQLGQIDERLKAARSEYERLGQLSSARGSSSAQSRAQMGTYYDEVEKAAGKDAADAARRTGRALNIGQRGAEFKSDETGYYLEAEQDYFNGQQQNDQKRRFNMAEQQELARLEGEMYAAELDAVRVQKEMETRRLADLERSMDALMAAGSSSEDDTARIAGEADDAARSIAELTEQETDLLQSVEKANKRAAEQAEAAAAKALRTEATRSGQIIGAGTATTSQTALTVSAKSVENAEKLAAAMREAAEATERQATAMQNAGRREWELDTMRARSKIEQGARITAEQEIAATKTAAAEKIAIAQSEARIRAELAKGEARAIAEAAESATAQIKGEENRRTAILKSELKEREAAAKASARAQQTASTSAALSRPFGMSWGQLATGAAATMGIYGIDQVARGTFDAGKEGAMQMRQMETFENLAQRVGVSSAAVVRAIREASRETITSTGAMGLAAQVLSQKFATTSDDISGDIETLVKFSRRASQIYTDESGAFLSTQDVFARLIKFSREGNKELVDQFGLSNKAIADALGITVDGLASADGAAKRWQGMLMLLGDEMERLGEGSVSVADKFEADTARIDEAWNRIKRNLAEPVSAVVTAAADFTEGAAIKTGTADTDTIRRFVEQSNKSYSDIGKGSITGFDELLATLDKLDAASAKNADGAKAYGAQLRTLGQDIINNNGASDTQIAQMTDIGRRLDLVTSGQDSYTKTMEATTQAAIEQSGELLQLAMGMAEYERLYAEGAITLEQYTGATDMLAGAMTHLATEAGLAAGAIGAVNAAAGVSNGRGGTFYPNAIMGAGAAASPSAFNAQAAQDAYDKDRIDAQTSRDAQAREEKKRADEAAAKKAASEWESAAKKAQSAFEAAAQKTANEFKSALEKVPGLFGTSEVTAEDMELAKYGGYQNKADERLRVLADEVLNKKDTPEDPGDWARRMGMDPGTDPRRVLAEARSRWADSSLFAGGNNLDLIDAGAVEASKFRTAEAETGKQALLSYFGLETGMGLEDPAARDAFAEMIGLAPEEATAAGSEARQAFDAGFYAPAAAAAGSEAADGQGMANTLAAQLKTDIEAGEVADALYSLGGSIIGRIHAGYEAAAKTADWSTAVIQSLAAEVAPIVIEQIADQLPPKP